MLTLAVHSARLCAKFSITFDVGKGSEAKTAWSAWKLDAIVHIFKTLIPRYKSVIDRANPLADSLILFETSSTLNQIHSAGNLGVPLESIRLCHELVSESR